MELFEEDAVIPSLLDRGDLVVCLLAHTFRVHAFRHFHHLERVWLHEKGKGVATHTGPRQLITSNHAVRSGFKVTSAQDLS